MLRTIKTLKNETNGKTAIVYKDVDTNEFVVKLKGNKNADYFTGCKADALGTAALMIKDAEVVAEVVADNRTYGTARIGSGSVRHPAYKECGVINFRCACHSNNFIRSRVSFFTGLTANCKRGANF